MGAGAAGALGFLEQLYEQRYRQARQHFERASAGAAPSGPSGYDGRMDVQPHRGRGAWLLRRLALALWLASLILPTLPTPDIGNLPGTPLRGAYLLHRHQSPV